MKKRLFCAILALFLAAGFPAVSPAARAEQADLTGHIFVLGTANTHGQTEEGVSFARIAFLKKALKKAGAEVILLDAGNALSGLPVAAASRGEGVMDMMNAAGYDAMAPASEDFTYGADRLVELGATAVFPLVSSNVLGEDGATLLSRRFSRRDGLVTFGVFAVVGEETAWRTNPKNVEGLTFANPFDTARAQVESLEAEGCSVIVALVSMEKRDGNSAAQMLAEEVEGIDIILDGSADEEPGCRWVGDTLILRPGENLESVVCADITGEGETVAALLRAEDFGPMDLDGETDRLILETAGAVRERLIEVVGQSAATLEGGREATWIGETALGDLAADALREATGADAALLCGGVLGDTLYAGEITRGQLLVSFPHEARVVTVEVSGDRLLALLEHGVSRYPQPDACFPQVSGLTFRFDPSREAGNRVHAVRVGQEALEAEKTYVLATVDHLAAGGDGYPMGEASALSEYDGLEDTMSSYIAGREALNAPSDIGRVLVEALNDPQAEPGEEGADEE